MNLPKNLLPSFQRNGFEIVGIKLGVYHCKAIILLTHKNQHLRYSLRKYRYNLRLKLSVSSLFSNLNKYCMEIIYCLTLDLNRFERSRQ